MASHLRIVKTEKLADAIADTVRSGKGPVVFVALNKPASAQSALLRPAGPHRPVFFIDAVSSGVTDPDIVHVAPKDLDRLADALEAFVTAIPGEKTVVVESLATLLIYNDVNKVARFVNRIGADCQKSGAELCALSPKTKGEDLLDKIYNFFDKVEK